MNSTLRTAAAPTVAALYFALQWTTPFARIHPERSPPFPARFAWSMFAGPLTSRCEHTLTWSNRAGVAEALPLPPPGDPARAILTAHTRDEFSRASTDLIAYADTDADVARALDDFLRRYARSIAPGSTHTLTSVLRCDSPGAPAFSRTLEVRP